MRICRTHCRFIVAVGIIVVLPCVALPVRAQIKLDGTLGTAGALPGPNYVIPADLGKTFGSNLFHSFSDFNLATGESATFTGPNSIANLLSRVTGGNPSSIDGLITSTIPGVNFFFINPSGVLFGPNAKVNVGGSFAVSTASFLRLKDGGLFDAKRPGTSVLTSAPPSAFGFLDANPGTIKINGSNLEVAEGQSMSLIGGDITIDHGSLIAPGGKVSLLSVRSAGELGSAPNDPDSEVDVQSFSDLGDITISGYSAINLNGAGGGSFIVRGRDLAVTRSVVESVTTGNADAGDIDISVSGGLNLGTSAIKSTSKGSGKGANLHVSADQILMNGESALIATTSATGKGGDVHVTAKMIQMLGGAQIATETSGSGDGGLISITADSVALAQENTGSSTGIASITYAPTNGGRAGDVRISTGRLGLTGNCQVSTSTVGSGDSGNIFVKAKTTILDGSSGSAAEIAADTKSMQDGGRGGSIAIDTEDLILYGKAAISASSLGLRDGGSILVNANSVLLDGLQAPGNWGVYADTNSLETGSKGGSVVVNTQSLKILNGAQVSASSYGRGHGGSVLVRADGSVLDGGGNDATGIFADTKSFSGGGKGGSVFVDGGTGSLRIVDGGGICARTLLGGGDAGSVKVRANNILMDGGSSSVFTGISASSGSTLQMNNGKAGGVDLVSKDLKVLRGATISAGSFGQGDGGSVSLKSSDVLLSGRGNRVSSISADTVSTTSGGKGGSVTVDAEKLRVIGDAGISSSSYGRGDGGTIIVDAPTVTIDAIGSRYFSGIQANSHSSVKGGNGGGIQIKTGQLSIVGDKASISTNALGSGHGGSISIVGSLIDIDKGASVSSSSSGTGNAGKINVNASDTLSLSGNSSVKTSATSSNGGDIQVTTGANLKLIDSKISAQAGQDGGGIRLTVGDVVSLQNSQLSAEAGGKGGNIDIDPTCVVLNSSQITANAVQGNGGNIHITAQGFLPSMDSTITASSEFGIAGNVEIVSPNTNVGGSLLSLPSRMLSADSYLSERCSVRGLQKKKSSFVVLGNGGLSVEPGGLLPSFDVK